MHCAMNGKRQNACMRRGVSYVIQGYRSLLNDFMAKLAALLSRVVQGFHDVRINRIATIPSLCPKRNFQRAIKFQLKPLKITAGWCRRDKGRTHIRATNGIKCGCRIPYGPAQETVTYQITPNVAIIWPHRKTPA